MQEVYLAAYRNIGSLKNTDSIYIPGLEGSL